MLLKHKGNSESAVLILRRLTTLCSSKNPKIRVKAAVSLGLVDRMDFASMVKVFELQCRLRIRTCRKLKLFSNQ